MGHSPTHQTQVQLCIAGVLAAVHALASILFSARHEGVAHLVGAPVKVVGNIIRPIQFVRTLTNKNAAIGSQTGPPLSSYQHMAGLSTVVVLVIAGLVAASLTDITVIAVGAVGDEDKRKKSSAFFSFCANFVYVPVAVLLAANVATFFACHSPAAFHGLHGLFVLVLLMCTWGLYGEYRSIADDAH